jgi:DWNN domain
MAASVVQFKFKSAKEFEPISFSGTGIGVFELKRAIVECKSLHKGIDFDLSIVNEQTKEGESNSILVTFLRLLCACLHLRSLVPHHR